MKKRITKIFIWSLLIFSLFGFSSVFLLYTNQGLNFCFNIVSRIMPGKLTVESITGKLLGPINVEKVHFETEDINISAEKIDLEWQLKKLMAKKMPVTVVHANDIKVFVKPSEGVAKLDLKAAITSLKETYLPTLLGLEDVKLYKLSWQKGRNKPVEFEKIILRSHSDGRIIDSLQFAAYAKQAKILLQGSVKEIWDISWDMNLANLGIFFQGFLGSFDSQGRIYGKRISPSIEAKVKSKKFRYLDTAFLTLKGSAHIDWASQKKSKFNFSFDSPRFNSLRFSQLNLSGDITPIKYNRKFDFNLHIDRAKIFFPVADDVQHLVLNKASIHGLYEDRSLSAKGAFIFKNSRPIDIELNLPNLASFKGDLKLRNPSFVIPELNVTLKNIELDLKKPSDKISYQGAMKSGKGSVKIVGDAIFSQDKIDGVANIDGTNFLVVNNKEYRLLVSPKLKLQFKNDLLNLTGALSIPEALIKPSEFSISESLPKEIVYVKKDRRKGEVKSINLKTKIDVVLGEKVSIDIMGLTGGVKGKLQITDEPKRVATATGDLHIKNGRYNIYGQELKITKGDLHFLGGAVTNPEVNIEAVRNLRATSVPVPMRSRYQELTVGVRMKGSLDDPRIDLFSIPGGLSNPDILSYLVTGKSSAQVAGDEATLLLQAATALNFGGASEMGGFIGDLRNKLGFSEFGFIEESSFRESHTDLLSKQGVKPRESLTTSTSFILGRFLTPKIYVSYSVGLLDESNVFRAKYYINKYFSVQSESSSTGDNAVDFVYTVER